ncbi:MAG: DUF2845 domain-containing protein [Rhodanobacteraceae bacterium]|nr:MAG: DUF2845 domain-containing protein [Rhodanobacteraceae bacterium]
MKRTVWLLALLAPLALLLPQRAWALRCGTQIVKQGETTAQVRDACGEPFYVGHYVGPPGVAVGTPDEPVAAVTTEAWYYNFGPQRLMVRLEFSGGVLAREETLGYGFTGRGGPCDTNIITVGMSVADLIARCGFPATLGRNPLATAAYLGAKAPAWGESWIYSGDGSQAAREVWLQDGRVTDVRIMR